jgi:hypothetical protein
MWGRVIEIMTATWLLLSPFIFRAQGQAAILWFDVCVALLIAVLSSVSYWRPLQYAHLAILIIAIVLVLVGRFSTPMPAVAAHQNHIFVGYFLMMIAIIPNNASQPAEDWLQSVELYRGPRS